MTDPAMSQGPTGPARDDAGARMAQARRLLAPPWHTAVVVAIFLALAAWGAWSQHAAASKPGPAERPESAALLYLGIAAAQWGLLRFVVAGGLRRTGTRLGDLIGARWRGWKDVLRDVVIAMAVWALWTGATSIVERAVGEGTPSQVVALLPRTPLEIVAWIVLSLTAGICEEAIFRGYLQGQFEAFTGSAAAAVFLQALVFGVAHGYQGVQNIATITVYGLVFGVLANLRKSLRPGMILHAWTDLFSGLFAARP